MHCTVLREPAPSGGELAPLRTSEALFVMATAAALVSATEAIVPFSFFVSLAKGRCEGQPGQFLHPIISPGEPFVEGAKVPSWRPQ